MKNVDQIVRELFEFDPSLKAHEPEIRTIVSQYLMSKPDTKFDIAFVKALRAKLLSTTEAPVARPIVSSFISSFSHFSRALTLVGGAVVVVLVVAVLFPGTETSTIFTQQFNTVGKNSFGTLTLGEGASHKEDTALRMGGSNSVSELGVYAEETPVASGMPTIGMIAPDMAGGFSGGSSGSAPGKLIYPYPVTYYEYVYAGDELALTETEGDVYNRVKGTFRAREAASALKGFNLGLINLGAFGSMKLRYFEIAEDKANGYVLNVNLVEGQISMYPNYEQWTMYRDYTPLSEQDMPSDEKIIAIAEEFLKDYGIPRDMYGDPVIEHNDFGVPIPLMSEVQGASGAAPAMMVDVASTPDMPPEMPGAISSKPMPVYYPENVTVTFPLLIKGDVVYEDGGLPYGLQMTISIREKKVESFYNLVSQEYDVSSYDLITDMETLMSFLNANTVDETYLPEGVTIERGVVKLGTPTRVLMHHYMYTDNKSEELFVPALMFPIIDPPEGSYYFPKSVMVPLPKDFLNAPSPRPIIMY